MGLIATYKKDSIFWEEHPELTVSVPSFSKLAEASQDKVKTSNIMWIIYFVYDLDSPFANNPIDTRFKYAFQRLENQEEWEKLKDKPLIKQVIEDYIYIQEQAEPERADIQALNNFIHARNKAIKVITEEIEKNPLEAYTNITKLDAMAKNVLDIYKNIDELKKRVSREGAQIVKGQKILSLMASGIIKTRPETSPDREPVVQKKLNLRSKSASDLSSF